MIKVNHRHFWFYCFSTRIFSFWYIIIFCSLVFFPCCIETFEFNRWQEGFKENVGFFVRDKNIMMNNVGRHLVAGFNVVLQKEYLIYEGCPKNSSCFVEFGFLEKLKGIGMGLLNQSLGKEVREKRGYDCNASTDKDPDDCFHFLISVLLGSCIAGLGIILFLILTQR